MVSREGVFTAAKLYPTNATAIQRMAHQPVYLSTVRAVAGPWLAAV